MYIGHALAAHGGSDDLYQNIAHLHYDTHGSSYSQLSLAITGIMYMYLAPVTTFTTYSQLLLAITSMMYMYMY